VKAQDGYLPSF
jgi:hypothetical protein